MKRYILIGLTVSALIGGSYAIYYYHTKSFSPEGIAQLSDGELLIEVRYCRPYKKGREIFGGLEPFGEVWRTGANEATIFETNQDILVDGSLLKAGKYSLWTIPREEVWTVMFNNETGQWGIDFTKAANHDPERDVLTVDVQAVSLKKEFEQFTIAIEKTGEDAELNLLWDRTLVTVPISFTGR